MEDKVAWAGALLYLCSLERIGNEFTHHLIEAPSQKYVAAKTWHKNVTVGSVDLYRVGIWFGANDLVRRLEEPLGTDWTDAHQTPLIGSSKKPAPGAVRNDVWRAVEQRCARKVGQLATQLVDGEAGDSVRHSLGP